ncbi:O-antigen ligase family protein [Limnochorda pilosa]|uniref:Polymerase n=1 Tax=Limnochorda pilosa TaxID=1555112 RepID=A0A0K2SLN0_LIMPI|nr:O-antigen ligase family protein [Limnochorda pilosa]BAS27917.1 polymerase [Limnochorda pilosa]
MTESTVPATHDKWIDRVVAWLLPFHPVAGVVAVVLLSLRSRSVIRGLRSQRVDLLVFAALGLAGWASVWAGVDAARGAVNWLVPFAFLWLYVLGRWAVRDPEAFLLDLLRATGLLALVVVVARLFELQVSVAGITLLDRFAGPGGRGYVIGQGVNGLAVVLEVGAIGGLAWLATARTGRGRLEGGIIGILSLAAVFVTLSRGAMVGVAASAVAGALLLSWRVLIPAAALLGVALVSSPLFRERLLSTLDLARNVQRFRIWEGSLKLIRDHPWLGVGPGNFELAYPQYRLPEEYEHAMTPHNLYLNITTGWGIPGALILFGWIAWVMLRNLRRSMAPYKKVVLLILITFWVHVLFDDLITPQVGLLLGCLDRPDDAPQQT